MLSIHTSSVHPIPFCTLLIWFYIVLEHAHIINNDINTMGTNYWICQKDQQVEFTYESELYYFFSQNMYKLIT